MEEKKSDGSRTERQNREKKKSDDSRTDRQNMEEKKSYVSRNDRPNNAKAFLANRHLVVSDRQ